MKFLFSFIGLLFFAFLSFAQDVTLLPKDENGKYIYYEVVDVKNDLPLDSLQQRLLAFLSKNKKEIKYKTTTEEHAIIANGKMVINKSLTISSRPSGEIAYSFHFEVKGQKYRFWLTNFEFIPYQRDRYGNFVPNTTIGTALETEPKKQNAAQWNDYRLQASKYAHGFANRLKDYLENKTVKPLSAPEKKVVTKSW